MRTTLMTAVFLTMLTQPMLAEQPNLLSNGGFEQLDAQTPDFPAHWTVSKERGLDFAPQRYRDQRAGMVIGDGKARVWVQDTAAPDSPIIQLEGMVKAEHVAMNEGDYANFYVDVFYKGRPDSEATRLQTRIEPGGYDWSRVLLNGKALADREISHLRVTVDGKFSGGRFYVDELKLTTGDLLSPARLLNNKLTDLLDGLDRVGEVDASVGEARVELKKGVALLEADPPDVDAAREHWISGVGEVSHDVWAKMHPDAVNGKPLLAQMMYHGLVKEKQGCDYYLDRVEAAGCNGVYLSLGSWSGVGYESDVLPTHEIRPLKYFIEEAHRRGIKVLAYIAVFHGTHDVESLPASITQDHPDWLATRGPVPTMRIFLDPANPQTVEYMAKAYVELATRYDIDGIGLDYIRYPDDTSLNYDQRNRDAILSRYGIDIFAEENLHEQPEKWAKIREYRRDIIANAVKTIHDAVKQASPDTTIMACLVSEPAMARDQVAQAWMDWGPWVDYASPMNYVDRPMDSDVLDAQKQGFEKTRSLWIPAVGGMPYNTHDVWTISDWAKRVAATRRYDPDGMILYRNWEFDMGIAAFFRNGPFYGDPEFPSPLSKE